eukprot:3707514-Rhodomonas_salina.1
MSGAHAFELDEEELVTQLTRRCLRTASDLSERDMAPVLDEQGSEVDGWEMLRGYLARLDGTKKRGGGEEGVEEGREGGRTS